jgi:heme exporter protein A
MTDIAAVRAERLSKAFGNRPAVRGVDFSLADGECLALFGPNGAGKTTLLRLIAGLLKPSEGSVRVRNVDMRQDAPARAAVGLVSHQTMLYPPLTARENVEFAAELCGVESSRSAADSALRAFRVADIADVPVRKLSRGQQQRVSIARALVHGPAVVLLDEPYSGLDEGGAAALTHALGDLRKRGAAMILVTHNLAEGLQLASRAAVMLEGRFALEENRPAAGFEVAKFSAEYRKLAGVQNG